MKVPWAGACLRSEFLGKVGASVQVSALLSDTGKAMGVGWFFSMLLLKNDKANISNKEKTALQLTAKDFLNATDKQLQELISTKKYREVTSNEQDS